LALAEIPAKTTRKTKTVYATMHPPGVELPPASTGVEGAGSVSGSLEVIVKSVAKKSIGVGV
jgi:hypothetical protein